MDEAEGLKELLPFLGRMAEEQSLDLQWENPFFGSRICCFSSTFEKQSAEDCSVIGIVSWSPTQV